MAQEEKQLLLKDLCARLPYMVKVHIIDANGTEIDDELTTSTISHLDRWVVKPYLRPMSSRTEEEWKEYTEECNKVLLMRYRAENHYSVTDWLLSHHFDFRGLIEKGLAIEAPEDMYEKGGSK